MRWESTVAIHASADRVWDLTINIEDWPAVTPTVQSVQRLDAGPVRVGSRARLKQPGQTKAVWTVTRLVPGREFVWETTRMGVTITGSHQIEATDAGCRNTLAIDVAGRGARAFGALFGGLFMRAIKRENAAFKAKAES